MVERGTSESTAPDIRRVRIRFGKEGDLRFISHRDLVRTFERMLRRAGLELALSQGYHPRPQMTFPDALALGVEARNEVAEVVVRDPPDEGTLYRKLAGAAPPGLRIGGVEVRPPHSAKARVLAVCYEYPLAPEQVEPARRALARFRSAEAAHEAGVEIDIRQDVLALRLPRNVPCPAKPQDILAALGLADPRQPLTGLIRTDVQLVS